MSVPVVFVDNVEGTLSRFERTKSHGTNYLSGKENSLTLGNGQVAYPSSEPTTFRVCDLSLPDGDSYSGSLFGNMPEGSGKYVWSDDCIYEGEWNRGMRHGLGKIQWPSGAVYEGEFSGGYINGEGTYTGPNKIIYRGRWRLNLKHGLGYQKYPNGDSFEGSWSQGTIEGFGKYIWANGNVYLGHMKGGKMSGKGTLTWTNGDTFEGSWLDGMMHGLGVYTWYEGGSYVGIWTSGLKDGKGALYPNGSRLPAAQELYLNALRKRGILPEVRKQIHDFHSRNDSSVDIGNFNAGENPGSSHETLSDKLPRRNQLNSEHSRSKKIFMGRRWSLEPAIEKVLGQVPSFNSVESFREGDEKDCNPVAAPVLEREYTQGVLISEVVLENSFSTSKRLRRQQKKLAKEIKRPGEQIIKGHRSYDLMLSLQLGIRYTVGKITPIQRRDVRVSDFGPRASFWMSFPRNGSQVTPSHHAEDFKWKDYCPMVFRNLRELFKIDAADYMMSICGSDALRELSSPGKSGSVFFLSQDDRFMIKTLRKSEVKVLLRMLRNYHHHVRSYENTLVTKFFGLHRVKPSSGQKFRFVVMGNMFCTALRIHRRFDLKGSSLGRSTDKVQIDENTTLKDLDLNYCFYLEPSWREALLKQIKIDSKFLESEHIMDYSLLLGVHYRAPRRLQSLISYQQCLTTTSLGVLVEEEPLEDETANHPEGLVLVPRGSDDNSFVVGPHIRGSRLRASAVGDEEVDLLLPGTARLHIQLGVNMPARAELLPGVEKSQLLHEVNDVVLYVGIIDILQDYNMGKKIEHAYKSFQFDSISISAVDPTFYSTRFLEFIEKVFPEKPS